VISKEVAAGVFTVSEPYRLHGPQYAPIEDTTISMPPIIIMREMAHAIIARCAAMIEGERHQTDFQPVTGGEAAALKIRVQAAYRAQIAAFDPTKVFDEFDRPNIPLETAIITPSRKLSK
jgi:hypothetical protein